MPTAPVPHVPVRVFHCLPPFPLRSPESSREDGRAAICVFACTVPADRDPLQVAEEIYTLLNVGDDPAFGPPDARAVAYRRAGNRSASVGDTLQIGSTFYEIAPTGFTVVPPVRPVQITVHGSTPLPPHDEPDYAVG